MVENSGAAPNLSSNLIKGDFKSSTMPPFLGLFAGFLAFYLDDLFPNRGYLSDEYYLGVAFEFQLIVLMAFLFSIPLLFFESKRLDVSLSEMILGSIICNFICLIIAYGHGYFPLLLIFYIQWLWICYFWQKKLLPPFRYSIWISLGLLCGAIAGSILALSIFN